jgi:MoxR-like ATPase
MSDEPDLKQELHQFSTDFAALRQALAEVMVGHVEVIELTLAAMVAGGHVLLDGPPGVGKTLLGRTLAQLLDVKYRRIQFTSDLMPADVIGTYIVMESQGRRRFEFQQGPIFTNLLLADEINRATPKTQAALFEALEERSLTVANETYELPAPFFALATQSLGDIEGTFPVPETQLDRFFFKLTLPAPTGGELETVLQRTTEAHVQPVKRKVLAADAGRTQISRDDVRRVALPALRHRITLNFEGHAQETGIDGIVADILRAVT